MPEGGRTSYEHEIEEKLKKLDAKINVPEIPDAQAIFERAEKKKNNIFSIRTVRYAAAAAVILICVSIPTVSMLMTKNGVGTEKFSAAVRELLRDKLAAAAAKGQVGKVVRKIVIR